MSGDWDDDEWEEWADETFHDRPRGPQKKPGNLGERKGTDALRAENDAPARAAREAGLNQEQAERLHRQISGRNLTYEKILDEAIEIGMGNW